MKVVCEQLKIKIQINNSLFMVELFDCGSFQQLKALQPIEIVIIQNRIEIMSKSIFSFEPDLKNTPINKVQNKQRLLKIQQKLSAITLQRQTQAKDQLQEQLTRRITELQAKCVQQVRQMEYKVRILREELGQAKLKEIEFSKKAQLSRKTRNIDIAEIRKKITNLSSFQTKDRNQIELALARSLEIKTDSLLNDLRQTKQIRVEKINELEDQLQTELPQAHFEIRDGCATAEQKLEILHRNVKEQSESLREQLHKQQFERQKTVKSIMQMINSTVEEIKVDLQQERIARNKNRQQLLALFNSAYGKLNPLQ